MHGMRARPIARTGTSKRLFVAACVLLLVRVSAAQTPGGPALSPAAMGADQQGAHSELDGKCNVARPGDVVHFTLHVEGVQYARAVYADLQMRLGKIYAKDASGIPAPDFRHLGGGGPATRDGTQGNVYHFAFVVPRDVLSGLYHGSGVYVTATPSDTYPEEASRSVDVTAHTQKEIRRYCLIIVSPLGAQGRPLVTDFKGGPVERKVVQTTGPEPASSRIFLPTR
jgi:hypothetical protein